MRKRKKEATNTIQYLQAQLKLPAAHMDEKPLCWEKVQQPKIELLSKMPRSVVGGVQKLSNQRALPTVKYGSGNTTLRVCLTASSTDALHGEQKI